MELSVILRKKIMEFLHSQSFFRISKALTIAGYSLCLGSIACFIAMNAGAGNNPDANFWQWQRIFIGSITHYVTAPSLGLFLAGNIGLYLRVYGNKDKKAVILLLLSVVIAANGWLIILPLAESVNSLAALQFKDSQLMPEFAAQKATEDACGGVNLLFLISYSAVYLFGKR